jgi:hypothetical protein
MMQIKNKIITKNSAKNSLKVKKSQLKKERESSKQEPRSQSQQGMDMNFQGPHLTAPNGQMYFEHNQ